MQLSSGQLALANVTFLVADDELACEDLIIGLPVLRHLQVDTRTLLENNRAVLDGADCSDVWNPTRFQRGGTISGMMIARLNRLPNTKPDTDTQKNRPPVNFYSARLEEDPFPDPSLLDPVDSEQHDTITSVVADMKDTDRHNGLPEVQ